jgi:hypothetical protein
MTGSPRTHARFELRLQDAARGAPLCRHAFQRNKKSAASEARGAVIF